LQLVEYQIIPNHLHLTITILENNSSGIITTGELSPLIKKSISSFCNHLKGNISNWCIENEQGFK
jgi:hypothetical protein